LGGSELILTHWLRLWTKCMLAMCSWMHAFYIEIQSKIRYKLKLGEFGCHVTKESLIVHITFCPIDSFPQTCYCLKT